MLLFDRSLHLLRLPMYADTTGANFGIDLGGRGVVSMNDVERQTSTVREILSRLVNQPGVVLADEVGMGKTYVALGVAASVIESTWKSGRPVIVTVPRGLVGKWERDWDDFTRFCVAPRSRLRGVTPRVARRPMELFRLFEKTGSDRPRLVITSASAYTGALSDPWTKLLLVRIAMMRVHLVEEQRKNLEFWLPYLIQQIGTKSLTKDAIQRLLRAKRNEWPNRLRELDIAADDASLIDSFWLRGEQLDWAPFAGFLNVHLLSRRGQTSSHKRSTMRSAFGAALSAMFTQWRALASWESPLLILDEAHHAKNDRTRLAKLFRSPGENADVKGMKPALEGKFDRMLLLTATPFQLGHQELIRIIRCLGAVRWSGKRSPIRSRPEFAEDISELGRRLDANRRASLALQRAWGNVGPSVIASRLDIPLEEARTDEAIRSWLHNCEQPPSDSRSTHPIEREISQALAECRKTKQLAEDDTATPWASLRTWVIRHNRPTQINTKRPEQPFVPRRAPIRGSAINDGPVVEASNGTIVGGLTFGDDEALAFLLAARAQGEAAAQRHRKLVQFAGGLCSSYEAFHHTRTAMHEAEVVDDDSDADVEQLNGEGRSATKDGLHELSFVPASRGVPLSWYTDMIARHVPGASRTRADVRSALHPKLGPVVNRVVDLWERGEKSLVFCFYRQTSMALRSHIDRAVRTRIGELAVRRTGLADVRAAQSTLESISRRLGEKTSPFHKAIREQLTALVHECTDRKGLPEHHQKNVTELLLSYVRSVPFLVRSLPEDAPEFYAALNSDSVSAAQREQAVGELLAAVTGKGRQRSGAAVSRFRDFLEFIMEASTGPVDSEADVEDETMYTDSLTDGRWDRFAEDLLSVAGAEVREDTKAFRKVRAGELVRMVNGETSQEDRQRVMRAFNSPLFPEILISSSVLGEGVDLHRFCRHVIHHDLDWNPSRLEQRTGRVDRIRCLAERDEASILVYEPYIAGSADERMFRVVQDRQRWFQVVMGQRYDLTEAQAEEIVERLPLPASIREQLTFRLHVQR